MIRTPTEHEALYAWYTAAMRGEAPPVHEGEPQCGWYKLREYPADGQWVSPRKRAWLPARIWVEQHREGEELAEPEQMRAAIGRAGHERDCAPAELWLWVAKTPISPVEWNKLYFSTEAEE